MAQNRRDRSRNTEITNERRERQEKINGDIAKKAEDATRHQNIKASYGLKKVLSIERPKQNETI